MPRSMPFKKVTATREYGANVVLYGANYDQTYHAAFEQSVERGATFLHAFNDEELIADQGTIGLETTAQNPALDVVIVPVGGGLNSMLLSKGNAGRTGSPFNSPIQKRAHRVTTRRAARS